MSGRAAVGLFVLLLGAVGCEGGDAATYPRTWSLAPSPEAIAQVEAIGWDATAFYELVTAHARILCFECNVEIQIDGGGGTVRVDGTRTGNGILGAAAAGSGVAGVNQAEIFQVVLGPAPEYPALEYTTIDEAAYLVAVIVAHEVGHALSLPHNPESTVMEATPNLLISQRHAFTDDEVDQMRSATGQQTAFRPGSAPGLCPCCIAPGVRVAGCEE